MSRMALGVARYSEEQKNPTIVYKFARNKNNYECYIHSRIFRPLNIRENLYYSFFGSG